MSIDIRRVYEKLAKKTGKLFLVDRVWPRGVKKDKLADVIWLRDVAPSTALRKWFGHDPQKWERFLSKYFEELDEHPDTWSAILEAAGSGSVTLLYGAKDTEHNQAVALRAYLEKRLKHTRAS
ncbi:MAG: DUF488 family protein [Cyanobacteria bacterium SZAS LIN-3]|nr:DUF488 family protein [Cyanobacteria bacterium SZAS LIN-3]MBS2010323.1 DUF488 family protein [Cyanobacteria bacterium SZAS TMP-1]